MKVMILAAGLGERMRPLTDHTPKPLLKVAGKPLIEHHILRLAEAGLRELVVNVSHLAAQIVDYCGDGSRWDVSIEYSHEERPLETAGGIVKALPLLGDKPFGVVNGDVWLDYPFTRLAKYHLAAGECAHLVLVDNPEQHPLGDFLLDADFRVRERPAVIMGLTYAGVAIFRPEFFDGLGPDKLALRPLLDAAIDRGCLGGEHHGGSWEDVGTPERLHALDAMLRANQPVCSEP